MTLKITTQSTGPVEVEEGSGFTGQAALRNLGLEGHGADPLFNGLRSETRPDLLAAKLFAIAQKLEGRQEETARRLYKAVSLLRPDAQWGLMATQRQKALAGEAGLEEKIERIAQGLMPAVTDPVNLGGMLAAMRVFRGVSSGVLKYLGQPSLGNRALSTLLGFGAEVPGFVLTGRAIRHLGGIKPQGPAPVLSEEIYHAALTLGALKAFGLAGSQGVAALGQKGIQSRLLPQGAMFLGVLGAQGVESKMGLRAFRNGEEFLTQGLATYLHFFMSGAILGPLAPLHQTSTRHKLPLLENLPRWVAIQGEGPLNNFPGFFNKALSERPSPIPSSDEVVSGPRTKTISGIQPSGRQAVLEGLKKSFGHFQHTIQLLYMDAKPLETWVKESLDINAQLAREVKVIQQFYSQDNAPSSELAQLARLSGELHALESRLRTGDIPYMDYSEEHIKVFLRHYYGISNKLVNFLDGLDPIEAVLQKSQFAKEALEELLEGSQAYILSQREDLPYSTTSKPLSDPPLTQRIPAGPLFDPTRTEAFVAPIQAIGGELMRRYTRFDPEWHYETSVGMQELRQLLGSIRDEAKRDQQPPSVLGELAQLQRAVSGVIRDLDHVVLGPAPIRQLEYSQDVLRELYQIPSNLADFLREGDMQLLRITTQLAINSRTVVNNRMMASENAL